MNEIGAAAMPYHPQSLSGPPPAVLHRSSRVSGCTSASPGRRSILRGSVLLLFLTLAGLMLLSVEALYAQDCGCTTEQVRKNLVSPCAAQNELLLRVQNEQHFRTAINEANARGGNTTILLDNGVYRVASTTSFPYITGSNVILRSSSGNRDSVILEGRGMRDVQPATENGLLIAGDHVTIADLTIRNVGNHGIQVSGHGLLVHNVRIQDTYQQMLKGATERAVIDSGVVQCCMFEYTAGVGPNYYIGGIDVHKGRNWIVRDNVFENIRSPAGSVAEHAVHFWNTSENSTVERNLIINCDRGIGFGLGNSTHSGGIIRNNFIAHDGGGSFPDVGIGLESSPGTKVYNNTIFISYPNAIEYRFASTRDVHIVNNLSNQAIRARDGASAMLTTNVTDARSSWFVEAGAGNLRLSSALPAVVDAGSDLGGLVPDDMDKTPRPQASAMDIGAHEWKEATSTDEIPDASGFSVYPNPGSGLCTVSTVGAGFTLTVSDVLGRRVLTTPAFGSSLCVDLRAQPPGVYFFMLRNGNGRVLSLIPVLITGERGG
ncbi:MAG: T9SS type A sorting domain-containing protein [Bacteroidia bacterium]|nr:T9SS type A sorting domain-containing protein [Bacteroidia bacterium]